MECKTLQFPWKLHVLLAHTESKGWTDIVSWLPEGTAFKVHDKKRFEQYIMPKYFKTTTYKSFQRNCNIWGFETKTRGFETGFLFHPYFQKGKSDLCNRMVRGGKETPVVFNEKAEAITSTVGTYSRQPPPSQEKPPSMDQKATHNIPSLSVDKMESRSIPSISSFAEMVPEKTPDLSEKLAILMILHQQYQQRERDQEAALRKLKEAQRQMDQEVLLAALNWGRVPQMRESASAPFSFIQTSLPFPPHESSQGNPPPTGMRGCSTPERRLSLNHAGDGKMLSPPLPMPEATKAEVRRYAAAQEGRVRLVSCRARNVPLTHNTQSAVFEISEDTAHGSELLCSHPSCRASGVKFKYCAHCKVPVSKRTFWALHAHGATKKAASFPRCQKASARKRDTSADSKTRATTTNAEDEIASIAPDKTALTLSELPPKRRKLEKETASAKSMTKDSFDGFLGRPQGLGTKSSSPQSSIEQREAGSTEAKLLRLKEQQRLHSSHLVPELSSLSSMQRGISLPGASVSGVPLGILLPSVAPIRAIDERSEDPPKVDSKKYSTSSSNFHVIP